MGCCGYCVSGLTNPDELQIMKKNLLLIVSLILGISIIGQNAFAAAFDWDFTVKDASSTPYTFSLPAPTDGFNRIAGFNPFYDTPVYFEAGSGISFEANHITAIDVPQDHITGLAEAMALKAPFHHIHAANDVTGLTSFENNTTSSINYIQYSLLTTTSTFLATSGGSGLMSGPDKSKIDSLATVATSGAYGDLTGKPSLATVATSGSYTDLTNKPTIVTAQKLRVQTNSSGTYTWTFPTPYATGTLPIVSASGEDATTGLTNLQITAISNTSVTVQSYRITSALGILSLSSTPQIYVHLMALPQ